MVEDKKSPIEGTSDPLGPRALYHGHGKRFPFNRLLVLSSSSSVLVVEIRLGSERGRDKRSVRS